MQEGLRKVDTIESSGQGGPCEELNTIDCAFHYVRDARNHESFDCRQSGVDGILGTTRTEV